MISPNWSQSPRITKVENEGYHLGLPWFCLEFSVSISLSVHYGKMAPFPGTKHAIPQRRTEASGEEEGPFAWACPGWGGKTSRGEQRLSQREDTRDSVGSFSPYLEMFLSKACVFFQALSLFSAFFLGVRVSVVRVTSLPPSLPLCLTHSHTHTHTHSPAAEAATGKHCCARIGVQGFGFLEEPPAKQEATTHHHFF